VTELKPFITLSAVNNTEDVAYAKLVLPSGKFTDFVIDPQMAENLMVELKYHTKQLERRIADAPRRAPPEGT
tara:strand:+ start:215 stop:430 length:216 start_codon:yes stop_codon:yes gene_type:complete